MNNYGSEPRLLIDGTLREARSGARFANFNPATLELIGSVADAGSVDMDDAIAAARRAFDGGSWVNNPQLRKKCLLQLKAAMLEDSKAYRAELVAETGTPVALARSYQFDTPVAHAFELPVRLIDEYSWEREIARDQSGLRVVRHEPVGVVGAIIPWNFPVEVMLSKLCSLLAAGCTTVLKPAPDTPFNASRLGRLIATKTDIPAGVVNVVSTSDNNVAGLLATDPRVDAVSFTGSTTTGRHLMAAAAPTLKRMFLELGGKSPQILLDDADFPAVLAHAGGICLHAGQGCAIPTRLLLPRSRYEEGLALVEAAMRAFPWGDPQDPNNLMGPVINERQQQRILGLIATGVAQGARLVLGGRAPDRPGWFVEPTLFADVDNQMTIAQEEIFGPVQVVIPYEDEDDAVRIANDSQYGLAATVNGSAERSLAVARRIRVGAVSVGYGNCHSADTPFGGVKQSGFGRQNGVEGMEQYLDTKAYGIA
jgi:aldehyde dehydrogenase (NAD+)